MWLARPIWDANDSVLRKTAARTTVAILSKELLHVWPRSLMLAWIWCCHWDLPSTALASPSPLQADPATLLDIPAAPHLTNAHRQRGQGWTNTRRSAPLRRRSQSIMGSSRYKGPDTAGSDKFRPDRATIIPPAARLPFR